LANKGNQVGQHLDASGRLFPPELILPIEAEAKAIQSNPADSCFASDVANLQAPRRFSPT